MTKVVRYSKPTVTALAARPTYLYLFAPDASGKQTLNIDAIASAKTGATAKPMYSIPYPVPSHPLTPSHHVVHSNFEIAQALTPSVHFAWLVSFARRCDVIHTAVSFCLCLCVMASYTMSACSRKYIYGSFVQRNLFDNFCFDLH